MEQDHALRAHLPLSQGQQATTTRTRSPRLVGDGVVWLLVLIELLTFGLLFVSFAFARWREPGVFAQGQGQLNLSTGALNTLLLVGASWCAARAVFAFRGDRSSVGTRWLLGAMLGAIGFLIVKTQEFASKIAAGFDWADDSFTILYTLLTGFHFLHVLVGALLFSVLAWKARQGAYGSGQLNGPESGAVFWHMVDLLWMVLFPLVYVIR